LEIKIINNIMSNKYITDLPLISLLSAGDYIYVEQNNTSNSARLSSIVTYVNSEIKSNPSSLTINQSNITNNAITSEKITNNAITSEKINNNAITSEKINNNAITSEKINNNAITLDKLNSNVINTQKGLEFSDGIAVNLADSGGLMFNNTGELKLAPVASTSSIIVVRPSEADSTDEYWTARANTGGELRPCFKTLTSANRWARENINGNYTIFVDEDTIEGFDANYFEPSDSSNRPRDTGRVYWNWNDANVTVQYITQATVDTVFGNNSGMKEGLYVWPRIKSQKMEGGLNFGVGLGNFSKSVNFGILARYRRGTVGNYYYDTERYFDEAPRAINYNVYYTNNINLEWNNILIDSKWGSGTQASRISNWTNRIISSTTDIGFIYIRNNGLCVYQSKGYIQNINFVSRSNCSDLAVTDIQDGNLQLANVTISYLGTGFYNYSLLRLYNNMNLHICGTPLKSRQTNEYIYPGYGLAIVGNKYVSTNTNLSSSTLTNYFLTLEGNSNVRFIEYNAFTPNQSRLNASIIFDGDFTFNAGYMIYIQSGEVQSYGSPFIVNNFNIRTQRVDDSRPDRTHTDTDWSTFPLLFAKGISYSMYQYINFNKWTLDKSTTTVDQITSGLPIPMLISVKTTSTGTIVGDEFIFNTTTDNYKASNINYNVPYKPLSQMPQLSTYYRFTENGVSYSLNYGASVRD